MIDARVTEALPCLALPCLALVTQCERAVSGVDGDGADRKRGVLAQVRASPPGPSPLRYLGLAFHPHRCGDKKTILTGSSYN